MLWGKGGGVGEVCMEGRRGVGEVCVWGTDGGGQQGTDVPWGRDA